MDVSTDSANLAPNAEAIREANKAASTPELGDEGGIADMPRLSSPEAAMPSGEATRTRSDVEVWFETLPVVEELPRSEGDGVTAIAADGKTDSDKKQLPPADVHVASQTDDDLFNAEPDAPPSTRTFTFSVGRLA
ncbi:hypothetical protein HPB50_028266 [Hyalomma asiaticum]|nr:hypothetical protein HPB50_028266 [Hyalomma asiaticum]